MREIATNVVEPLGPTLGCARDAPRTAGRRWCRKVAMLVSMVLHELATNAVKYGALSNDSGAGRSALAHRSEERGRAELQIVWSERGGPPVEPADRKGFGTSLIQRGFTDQSGGRAEVEFLPSGVRCTLECPVSNSA